MSSSRICAINISRYLSFTKFKHSKIPHLNKIAVERPRLLSAYITKERPVVGKEELINLFPRKMSHMKKQDPIQRPLEKPMKYLQQLIERNFSGNQSNILIREFLWLAFDCFTHHKPFLTADERTKITVYSDQLVPALEETFVSIHGSMNRDKLVEGQIYLSGLKFLMDDFQNDQKLTEKFNKLWQSDAVQCVVDYVNNAAGTKPEYADDPPIDLTNVPKTHVWWNFP